MTPDDAELDLPQELRDGLIAVGEAARDLDQPWWIFGGAAMALYGPVAKAPDLGRVRERLAA